jgi:hypothetical protein
MSCVVIHVVYRNVLNLAETLMMMQRRSRRRGRNHFRSMNEKTRERKMGKLKK